MVVRKSEAWWLNSLKRIEEEARTRVRVLLYVVQVQHFLKWGTVIETVVLPAAAAVAGNNGGLLTVFGFLVF